MKGLIFGSRWSGSSIFYEALPRPYRGWHTTSICDVHGPTRSQVREYLICADGHRHGLKILDYSQNYDSRRCSAGSALRDIYIDLLVFGTIRRGIMCNFQDNFVICSVHVITSCRKLEREI